MMQGLMGKEETVVQHIEPPEEVCVELHLLQEPGTLPVCTHTHTTYKQKYTANMYSMFNI